MTALERLRRAVEAYLSERGEEYCQCHGEKARPCRRCKLDAALNAARQEEAQ